MPGPTPGAREELRGLSIRLILFLGAASLFGTA